MLHLEPSAGRETGMKGARRGQLVLEVAGYFLSPRRSDGQNVSKQLGCDEEK